MSHAKLARCLASAVAALLAVAAPMGVSGSLPAQVLDSPPGVSLGETRIDPTAMEHAAMTALRETAAALSPGRAVQVEVVDLRAAPDSEATVALEGVGRLRLDQGEWIPMRFLAGYDLSAGDLFGLRVQPIATSARAASGAVESGMGERVNDQIAARILSEFPDQPVEIVFVDLQPTSDSSSHVGFRGTGLVDFADEGVAPVSFNAILDRGTGLVVALDYSLEIAGAHGDGTLAASIAALR